MIDLSGNKNKRSFVGIFSLIIIYGYYNFFVFGSIINLDLSKNYLKFYSITIFALAIIVYVYGLHKNNIFLIELNIIFALLLIVSGFLITYLRYGYFENETLGTLLDFGARCIPTVLFGAYIAKEKKLLEIAKWIDIYVLLVTITIFKIVYQAYFQGKFIANILEFGMDYQMISYLSAFMLGLNMFNIIWRKSIMHSDFFNSRFYRKVRFLLLAMQLFSILYSGGRGGFVVVIVLGVYLLFNKTFIERNLKEMVKTNTIVAIVVCIAILLLIRTPLLQKNFARTIQFISPRGGINWEGTSGRDTVFNSAINVIKQSPIIGHGIGGGYYFGVGSAHNLFLDVLIEGGIIYLTIWIAILISFFRKIIYKVRIKPMYNIILIIFLGDFINLMFSSIYLRGSIMWFCLSFVFVDSVVDNTRLSDNKKDMLI